jgi:hypothetical protein
MARICGLYRLDRQHADGVNRQLIDIAMMCHSSAFAAPQEGDNGVTNACGIAGNILL